MKKQFKFRVKDNDFKVSSWTGGVIQRCVMVAIKKEGVAIRDTKDPKKSPLYFTRDEFDAFVEGVKAGEFNL